MAGDWIQIDDDLVEKPEVQAIQDETGDSVETVVGRLVRLWILVDRHAVALPKSRGTVTGLLPRYQIGTVVRLCGGLDQFWQAVVDVGWLTIETDGLGIPGYLDRFGSSAKNRLLNARRQRNYKRRQVGGEEVTHKRDSGDGVALPRGEKRRGKKRKGVDRVCVEEKTRVCANGGGHDNEPIDDPGWARSFDRAARAARKGRLPRPDPGQREFLLKVARMIELGGAPESWLIDAITGLIGKNGEVGNRWGYLFTILRANAPKHGVEDFEGELARVVVPPSVLEHRRRERVGCGN